MCYYGSAQARGVGKHTHLLGVKDRSVDHFA
jgi:hypothetical protein